MSKQQTVELIEILEKVDSILDYKIDGLDVPVAIKSLKKLLSRQERAALEIWRSNTASTPTAAGEPASGDNSESGGG